MLPLVIGLAVFFGIHLLTTVTDLRQGLIARFGIGPYKMAYSVIAFIGLAVIAMGYHKLQVMPGKNPQIWSPPNFMRHITMLLMLFAFILLAAAYIPSRIRTMAKHPMLAAVKLWAVGHLLANGDLGSIVLFGSFLAWAIYDRISVKRRGALGPLGTAKGGAMGDVAVLAVGVGAYLVMLFWGHAILIGVPLVTPPAFGR